MEDISIFCLTSNRPVTYKTSPFVAAPPDFLLFCSPNQVVAEIRMGNIDQGLRTLPGWPAGKTCNAVFRDDIGCLRAGRCNNITRCKVRDHIGMQISGLVGEGGMHGKKSSAVLCFECTGDKVNLSACT